MYETLIIIIIIYINNTLRERKYILLWGHNLYNIQYKHSHIESIKHNTDAHKQWIRLYIHCH